MTFSNFVVHLNFCISSYSGIEFLSGKHSLGDAIPVTSYLFLFIGLLSRVRFVEFIL